MEKLIRDYAKIMKELGITGLEFSDEKERKVRIEMSPSVETKSFCELETNENKTTGDYYIVKSPIVGVFYAGPSENAEPFVSVNDCVKPGSTLCIIESMKLMNEILSEEVGVIDEVCVKNGELVEYGTELFRIRR